MEQTKNTLGLGNTRQIMYEDFPPSSDWTHDANCHVLLIDLPGFKREELKVRVDSLRKVTVSGERQVSEKKYSRFKQMYELPKDSDVDNISGRFDNGLLFVIIPKLKTAAMPANEIEEEKKEAKPEKKDVHDKQKHETKDEKLEEPKKGISDERKGEKREEEPKKKTDDNKPKEGTKWNNMKGSLPAVDRKKIEEDMRKMAERVKNKEELEIMMKSAMDKIRKNKTVIITAVLAFSLGLYISRKYQSGGN